MGVTSVPTLPITFTHTNNRNHVSAPICGSNKHYPSSNILSSHQAVINWSMGGHGGKARSLGEPEVETEEHEILVEK